MSNWRDKLSVAADIATIAGLSALGVVTPDLFKIVFGRAFNLTDLLAATFYYALVFSICGSVVFGLATLIFNGARAALKRRNDTSNQRNNDTPYLDMTLGSVFLLAFLTIFSAIFGPVKDLWASFTGNDYMFPAAPSAVVERVDVKYDSDKLSLIGKVILKGSANTDDYQVVIYTDNAKSNDYGAISRRYSNTGPNFAVSLETDGSFYANNIGYRNKNTIIQPGIIIAVITRLDNYTRERFPREIAGKNSSGLKNINAFTMEIR